MDWFTNSSINYNGFTVRLRFDIFNTRIGHAHTGTACPHNVYLISSFPLQNIYGFPSIFPKPQSSLSLSNSILSLCLSLNLNCSRVNTTAISASPVSLAQNRGSFSPRLSLQGSSSISDFISVFQVLAQLQQEFRPLSPSKAADPRPAAARSIQFKFLSAFACSSETDGRLLEISSRKYRKEFINSWSSSWFSVPDIKYRRDFLRFKTSTLSFLLVGSVQVLQADTLTSYDSILGRHTSITNTFYVNG